MRLALPLVVLSLCAGNPLRAQALFAPSRADRRAPVRERMLALGAEHAVTVPGDAGLPQEATGPMRDAELDDSVPLPEGARYRMTPAGDVLVAPASGDHFFLGFAAGDYAPPPGERVDPRLHLRALAQVDGRPAATLYAYVMFAKRPTAARIATLEASGARVLAFHPHCTVAVAMPPEALAEIARLDFVHWVGEARPWQKRSPQLEPAVASTGPRRLWVNVFESDLDRESTGEPIGREQLFDGGKLRAAPPGDASLPLRTQSHGWQQRVLERHGVQVDEWVESLHAFRVRADDRRIDELVELDFVSFVEPEAHPVQAHDESIPMIGADSTRANWAGGATQAVVGGLLDTGVDVSHVDFLFTLWTWGWDFTGSSTGPLWDDNGHGSHVAGTLCGDGFASPQLRGVAPTLASQPWTRLFVAKVLDANGSWAGGALGSSVAAMQQSVSDGTYTTPMPHFVSNSWGSFSTSGYNFIGSEANCRTLDQAVYDTGQMWIFASGNEGAGLVRQEAVSKNVLTVGSVRDFGSSLGDPGVVEPTSGQGPVGDGRWKPNVCAPGNAVTSVSAHTVNRYTTMSGTSMATPHVSGVVAQVLDRNAWMRYQCEAAESLLMASAITKDNQVLTVPGETHLNQYGAGRVDAWKAVYGATAQMVSATWGFFLPAGQWTFGDFVITPGCTRVVVCMTYSDVAAAPGASRALVSDYDLFVDQPPLDPNGNTGEWSAQISNRNNTEIRILDNPITGQWRWKMWPTSAPSGVYAGVTVYAIYGDTTPPMTLALHASQQVIRPLESMTFTADVANPAYVASAVYLDSSSSGALVTRTETTLGDGVGAVWGNKENVEVGNILHGDGRTVRWTAQWYAQGLETFTVQARSDNAGVQTASVNVLVDGTAPTAVPVVVSWSHLPGIPSRNTAIVMSWLPASDTLSGVAGYATSIDHDPTGDPGTTVTVGAAPQTLNVTAAAVPYYFHIRAIDVAGNAGLVAHAGPYWVGLKHRAH